MAVAATASRRTLRTVDPATGAPLAELPCADEAEVRSVVTSARRALSGWAALGLPGRAAILERVAKRWEQPALVERVATSISREMGKPLKAARGEAGRTAEALRGTLAGCSAALHPQTAREGGTVTRITREPLGVVAAITPWNFPVGMAREVVVPALLAGNTVVFKPSELVPLTGQAFVEPFLAELPADVLAIVQGDEATGKALVAADIDMVGFVGSVEAGRHIMAACAPSLKRLVLELGGKDPMIVCADADLPAAAEHAVRESMRNSGQVCCSVERIYVEAPAAERFLELVVRAAAALKVGPPSEDVFMGPLASEEQRRKVLAQIEDARVHGARVLLGGGARPGPGCFVEPTVITGITDAMQIARRETFGPVAAVRVVADAEEALRLANDSIYGLGASVWCGDPARGVALASRLQAGQVGVNRGLGGAGDPPWCGVKQSGFGFLGSPDGYRQFTRPLSVSWNEPA